MRYSSALAGAAVALMSIAWFFAPAVAHAQQYTSFAVLETDPGSFAVFRQREGARAIEGFVVDSGALVDTLRKRVLEGEGLGTLARVTAAEGATDGRRSAYAPAFESAYRFDHSFAAPFSAVQARLDLAPLDDDDGGGGAVLYPLASLLAVALMLGLYALYRMVAVQVRFAERRNNFVAAVSHELKTPLTAIRMYGEMLRDDMVEGPVKRKEYYATITAETERLSRLINNVLELSRLERRERAVQSVAGDVGPLVREVVEVFRPHAEREGFEVSVMLEPGLPAVRFDRDALTQVLFNLLDNAVKYGRGADARIVVHCGPSGEGGVRIAVADRGAGVDDAQLAAIFEPFHRAQNELTRTHQGTGIGLALVRGLISRMQGRVDGCNLRPGFEVRVTLPGA
jgi:signal transduction histidine kinase